MQSEEDLAAREVWPGNVDCGLSRWDMSREREFNADVPTRPVLICL